MSRRLLGPSHFLVLAALPSFGFHLPPVPSSVPIYFVVLAVLPALRSDQHLSFLPFQPTSWSFHRLGPACHLSLRSYLPWGPNVSHLSNLLYLPSCLRSSWFYLSHGPVPPPICPTLFLPTYFMVSPGLPRSQSHLPPAQASSIPTVFLSFFSTRPFLFLSPSAPSFARHVAGFAFADPSAFTSPLFTRRTPTHPSNRSVGVAAQGPVSPPAPAAPPLPRYHSSFAARQVSPSESRVFL